MEVQQQQLYLNKNIRLQLKREAKKRRISMSKLAEDLIVVGLNQLRTKSQSSLSDLEKLSKKMEFGR
jgi:hypothetical protein|tara:strand:- start:173 stop:373 length:201 start_codon:yes stop_codon:yes gene_type:complete